LLSATEPARGWIAELGEPAPGLLPSAVMSAVRRARAMADGADADGPPRSRVRTRSNQWLTVHASVLTPASPRTWAVVIEPARPAEVLPLVAQAHELTAREHEVFGMLLRGAPDKSIAQALVISDHTAREHVRRVQQKLGVKSRAELQALMHDAHYTPWVAQL
jgi:DNA-binding CsgD family transcriptional regulator